MRLLLTTTALALIAGSAQAASFDCAKARTAVEKRICAEPWLSKADSAMGESYAAAMAASPTPRKLKAAQQVWLNERDKIDDLDAAITTRGNTLAAQALADRRVRRPVPLGALATRCAPVFTGRCTVQKSGKVAGAPDLWWQILDGGEEQMASVVLEAQPGGSTTTPLVWTQDVGVAFYDAPKVARSPDGELLILGGALSGTGGYNIEVVLQRTGRGRWVEIDSQGWVDKLPAQLPRGMGVWKGVYPNYDTLTATTALWKDADANCCPTGGRVAVKLRLEGDSLVIADTNVKLGEDAARAE